MVLPASMITSATTSRRRLVKLSFCFLTLAGTSCVPLADAFNHGRLVAPMHTAKVYSSASFAVRGPPSLVDLQSQAKCRGGKLSMSAENKNELPKPKNTRVNKNKRSAMKAMALGLLAITSSSAVAHAAKKVAATAASDATLSLVLPTIPRLFLVCLVPTLLGYYKSEYGVSYGYGTAMAASSYLILSSIATAAGLPLLPGMKESLSFTSFQTAGILSSLSTTLTNLQSLLPNSLPAFHAFALFFYGTRLDLFLFYREVFLARFRAMRERIEERAKKQGGRLARTPFLVSCAFLYFCMMSPLLITSQLCDGMGMVCTGPCGKSLASILESCLRVSVFGSLFGFLLGAFGDLNKTIGKAIQGEDALITGGIFRFFRHPNYTGEVIGWTSSCIAGFLAVAWKTASSSDGGALALWKKMAPFLLSSVMGAVGITFVLATATTGLEFRQKEKYGDTDEYKEWVKKSWKGIMMAPKESESSDDESGSS